MRPVTKEQFLEGADADVVARRHESAFATFERCERGEFRDDAEREWYTQLRERALAPLPEFGAYLRQKQADRVDRARKRKAAKQARKRNRR